MSLDNTDILIRKSRLSDLTFLANIEERADQLLKDRFPVDMTVCSIEELTDANNCGLLYVAEYEPTIVGFGFTRKYGKYLHLQQLSVLPEHGRKGIGTKLLLQILALVEEQNVKGMTLTTFDNVAWNAPFYNKHGFIVTGESSSPDYLKQILENEKSHGLTNRVAMAFLQQD